MTQPIDQSEVGQHDMFTSLSGLWQCLWFVVIAIYMVWYAAAGASR
jgi:hypothetical protein